jgi:hypothetical protein
MAIHGMQGTGDWETPDQRPKDYRQLAFKLFPDSPAPFTFILSKLGQRTVRDPEFKFFEWRLPKQTWIVETEVAATTSTTKGEVDTVELKTTTEDSGEPADPARYLKIGDVLINETTGVEYVRVVGITDDDTITVSRHWGDTGTPATTTIAADAVLRWAGSAYGEGTSAPTAVTRKATTVYNYTQISKDSAQVTGTALATEFRPFADVWAQEKSQALERHMMKLEWMLLHGVRDEVTDDNGKPLRSAAGFRTLISDAGYETDMLGTLTIEKLEDGCMDAFKYGSKSKLAFMGNHALNIINRLVRESTQFEFRGDVPKNKTYNLDVQVLRTPFGTLNLMTHPMMTESAVYTKDVYIIDTKYANYVKLRGRDTNWKERNQMKDDDLTDDVLGQWQTEASLELALPECHAVWKNLNATG